MSTFGVMFTPNQDRAAARARCACASRGGQIGLANWTPDGFVGKLFKMIGTYVPPAAGVKSPSLWGTRARIDELFGAGAERDSHATPASSPFATARRCTWIEVFRTYYGPIHKAFGALDEDKQAAFTRDLLALLEPGNRSRDRTLVLPSEYLEVVIEKT